MFLPLAFENCQLGGPASSGITAATIPTSTYAHLMSYPPRQ